MFWAIRYVLYHIFTMVRRKESGNYSHSSHSLYSIRLVRTGQLLHRRNHRDLKIGVIFPARVDNVPALIDLPVIEQEWLVDRAVALDKKTETLALTEQSAGGQQGNHYSCLFQANLQK